MTLGLFILFFPLAVAAVAGLGIFGTLIPSAATYTGVIIYLFFGMLLCLTPPTVFRFETAKPKRLLLAMIASLFVVMLTMIWIVEKFGPPAVLYILRGEIPPVDILFGAYREKLPLRALVAPLGIASLVAVSVPGLKSRSMKMAAVVAVVMSLILVSVYETRFVLIWPFVYWILARLPGPKVATRRQRTMIAIAGVVALTVFIVFGNIRSGITEDQVQMFALANDVEAPFARLPLPAIWCLIYFFGGTARGIANDSSVSIIRFSLPEKFFPGPLQGTAGHPLEGLNPRFEFQAFAIDAWHTYIIEFGVLGSIVLTCVLFALVWYIARRMNTARTLNRPISITYFLVVLWLSVRIGLMPIGDYLLDFSAMMELVFLFIFFKIADIRLLPPEAEVKS